jgi:SAM-dependent methyltransferase
MKEDIGKQKQENKCPVCSSNNAKIIRQITSSEASRFINNRQPTETAYRLSEYIEDTIWKQKTSCFMKCIDCSFEYSIPFKAADKRIYNILYSQSKITIDFWNWEFQLAFQTIQEKVNCIPNNEFKILELGSGSGHFIKKISQRLIQPSNCYVTEYSNNCRNEIKKLGVNCYSDIMELDKVTYSSTFDFICLFHLLEHVDNLQAILSNLNILAKTGALIIIAVPNYHQRFFFDKNNIFEDIPPIHISRFNRTSFNKISENMNWKMKYYDTEPSSKKEILKLFLYFKYMELPYFLHFEKKIFTKLPILKKPFLAINYSLIALANILAIFQILYRKNLGTSQIVIYEKR